MHKTSYRVLTLTIVCIVLLSVTAEHAFAWPCTTCPACETCTPTGCECYADGITKCGCGGKGCPGCCKCQDCVCVEASSFLNACNEHDKCYQACGSSKYDCDYQFSQNLASVCAPFSGDCEDACDWWADTYAGAVVLWGQPYWEDDQVLACVCCDC